MSGIFTHNDISHAFALLQIAKRSVFTGKYHPVILGADFAFNVPVIHINNAGMSIKALLRAHNLMNHHSSHLAGMKVKNIIKTTVPLSTFFLRMQKVIRLLLAIFLISISPNELFASPVYVEAPSIYDNAKPTASTFQGFTENGQTFIAESSKFYGASVYLGDPARPDLSSVSSLYGPASLVLYELGNATSAPKEILRTETVRIGSEAKGLYSFSLPTPKDIIIGQKYFFGLSTTDEYGIGLQSAFSSTYSGGAEAWRNPLTGEIKEDASGRDLAFSVRSIPVQAQNPKTIKFAGLDWKVAGNNETGPAFVNFSNSADQVWVDEENQKLHMKISSDGNGGWNSSQIELKRNSLGYGRYSFSVDGDYTTLDKNSVIAMFTYDRINDSVKNEIDIELSKWNGENASGSQYVVVTPPNLPGNNPFEPYAPNQLALTAAGVSTHSFTWKPDGIYFQSHYGSMFSPTPSVIFKSWDYPGDLVAITNCDISVSSGLSVDTTRCVPTAGSEKVLINFWMNGNRSPSKEQEIVISDFYFIPMVEIHNSNFSVANLSHYLIEGEGTVETAPRQDDITNYAAQLTAGSPVSLTQFVDTLDGIMHLRFGYQFFDLDGSLKIYLGGNLLGQIWASTDNRGKFLTGEFVIDDPNLFSLDGAALTFTYDGLHATRLLIDDIEIFGQRVSDVAPISEPATLFLFIIGFACVIASRESQSTKLCSPRSSGMICC